VLRFPRSNSLQKYPGFDNTALQANGFDKQALTLHPGPSVESVNRAAT
jgi:hypothetical protein